MSGFLLAWNRAMGSVELSARWRHRADLLAAAMVAMGLALLTTRVSGGYVASCCGETSSEKLFACVVDATQQQEAAVLASGKDGIVVVVTYVTANIVPFAAFATACVASWAEKNGYAMRILTEETSEYDAYDARWNKVPIVRTAAANWAQRAESIFWIDADAIVLDMDMTMSAIMEQSPSSELWISAENAGSSTFVNSGTFLIRNSAWSIDFLDQWWNATSRTLLSDQESFDAIRKQHLDKIKVLPPSFMNTDPPAMTSLRSGDRFLHLMGESLKLRAVVFQRAWTELCTACLSEDGGSCELKPQLGITAKYILEQTITVNGKEFRRLVRELRAIEQQDRRAEALMYEFQQRSHGYAHALNVQGEVEEAIEVQTIAFDELSKYVRKFVRSGKQVPPEILKRKILAGNQLLGFMPEDTERIYEDLKADLELLDRSVVEGQRSATHLLRSTVELTMAHNYVEIRKPSLALEKAKAADQALIYEGINEHNRAQPLATIANLQCQTKQFSEAYDVFDKILRIQSERLGAEHRNLATVYLNSGICRYEGGLYDTAKAHLQRAKSILEAHNVSLEDSQEGKRVKYFLKHVQAKEVAQHPHKDEL